MLAEILPNYEHETSKYPDSIRVSYADGNTEVYVLAPQMPHPIIMENIKIIRKWNGYNNQPMRRRRKP